MLFFLIQRRWFSPVLLGCYDILMDVIICDTLWYLIRPIGRLLKIVFCEMWGIILCSQCHVHVKDYVSKATKLVKESEKQCGVCVCVSGGVCGVVCICVGGWVDVCVWCVW